MSGWFRTQQKWGQFFYAQSFSRLDASYVPQHFKNYIQSVQLRRLIFSDHHTIIAKIQSNIETFSHFSLKWRYNEQILDNRDYILLVNNIWQYFTKKQQYRNNLQR